MALVDAHGRQIDYLRISITDHCNLKCSYCMPTFTGRPLIEREEILTYEELLTLADAAVSAGITKIRITGGEPLVRKGMLLFCNMLSNLPGLRTLVLTTNGVRLASMAQELFDAGVQGLNISLDTLQSKRFEMITGKDVLGQVLSGIQAAEAAGFDPIKINAVVMRGINDDEIASLAAMTFEHPYHVRFIEMMPFQNGNGDHYDKLFMPVDEIRERIAGIDNAPAEEPSGSSGPARLYRLAQAKGKIGFIAPVSQHFCAECNRLRLTADGHLRTCLFSKNEIDIKTPLRSGASKETLKAIIEAAIFSKPRRHNLKTEPQPDTVRGMAAIGG